MVKVRVPATTANLGPGFDSLGCALTLYATLSFSECKEGLTITGCLPHHRTGENLAVIAYQKTMQVLNLPMPGLNLHIDSDIPIARGLGSSAAVIVAGVIAANANHGSPLNKEKLLDICTQIEGHPDNVAPALYGGLIASMMDENKPYMIAYNLHPAIQFCVLIPDFKLSTHKARAALPQTIAFSDAVYNLSRTAVLCKALETNDSRLIRIALQDKLHQPYRSEMIHEYEQLREMCLAAGCVAFFISGAGPSCMCIIENEQFIQVMNEKVSTLKHHWTIRSLHVDREGAQICSVGGKG